MDESARSSIGLTQSWDVEYSVESWCSNREVDHATITVQAYTADAAADRIRNEDDEGDLVTVHHVQPHPFAWKLTYACTDDSEPGGTLILWTADEGTARVEAAQRLAGMSRCEGERADNFIEVSLELEQPHPVRTTTQPG